MDIAGFLFILGASARLTHLVTHDAITGPLRVRAGDGWLGYWLQCPWCVGLPITAATVAAYAVVPPAWFLWPAAVLTANLIWAQTREAIDAAIELHRERTDALIPPPPAPPPRGRGARHTITTTANSTTE